MAFQNKKEKRSPIKQKPLRNPGESLDRQIHERWEEEFATYSAAVSMAVLFALYEWARSFLNFPPQPIPVTLAALSVIAFSVYKVRKFHRTVIEPLKLGLEGEKSVGQFLEELRERRYRILHDIPAKNFNVDHVVVSTRGIFVLETKTFSKPSGDVRVTYDGEKILFDGFKPERNPISQVRALRDWLDDLLDETIGRRFPVKGVVIIPGWFVDPPERKSDIWVLTEKAFAKWIENESIVLKDEDVALVTSRLSDYVRNFK